ncbi:MAG TPA: P1 family peptidase [Acidobacteriota bacterium]|nr:P1 family peptidase [Acidobacteriota bacterium]
MRRRWRPLLMAKLAVALTVATALVPTDQGPERRSRLRELGVEPGVLSPGPLNAITDVAGVLVGHTTLVVPSTTNTGVTAILPHAGNLFREKVPGAVFVANGFGKLTGISQIRELGTIETPILLTGTLSVPRAADGLISYMLGLPGNEDVRSINPIVGETNDGYLSDIRARPIRPEHVRQAIESARSGAVAEGNVGAGAGTIAFGFKGGIGTSSRQLLGQLGGWTIGALVQTSFGGVLTIAGAPVGEELGRYYLRDVLSGSADGVDAADGSCMIVIATDAPLSAASLSRLALRAFMGMARTGAAGSNGSGDYVIAFSTHSGLRSGPDGEVLPRTTALAAEQLSPLFMAAIEATEESIYNSLFQASTTVGAHGTVEALPLQRTLEILREHGLVVEP